MLVNGTRREEKRTSRSPVSSQTAERSTGPPGQRTARPSPASTVHVTFRAHWIARRRTRWRAPGTHTRALAPRPTPLPTSPEPHRRWRHALAMDGPTQTGRRDLRPAVPVILQYLHRRSFAIASHRSQPHSVCSWATRDLAVTLRVAISAFRPSRALCGTRQGGFQRQSAATPSGYRMEPAWSDVYPGRVPTFSPSRTGYRMEPAWLDGHGGGFRVRQSNPNRRLHGLVGLSSWRHRHPRVEFHRLELRHRARTRFAVRADRKPCRLGRRHRGDADHFPHADATEIAPDESSRT